MAGRMPPPEVRDTAPTGSPITMAPFHPGIDRRATVHCYRAARRERDRSSGERQAG